MQSFWLMLFKGTVTCNDSCIDLCCFDWFCYCMLLEMSIALLCMDSWKDTAIGSPETISESKTVDGWIQMLMKTTFVFESANCFATGNGVVIAADSNCAFKRIVHPKILTFMSFQSHKFSILLWKGGFLCPHWKSITLKVHQSSCLIQVFLEIIMPL